MRRSTGKIPWQVLYRSISKKQRAPPNITKKKRDPAAFSSRIRERRAPCRLLFLFRRDNLKK